MSPLVIATTTVCDHCSKPAERFALWGKGDQQRKLCADCTQAALKREVRRAVQETAR